MIHYFCGVAGSHMQGRGLPCDLPWWSEWRIWRLDFGQINASLPWVTFIASRWCSRFYWVVTVLWILSPQSLTAGNPERVLERLSIYRFYWPWIRMCWGLDYYSRMGFVVSRSLRIQWLSDINSFWHFEVGLDLCFVFYWQFRRIVHFTFIERP